MSKVKKVIVNGGKGHDFIYDLKIDGERGDSNYELIRSGTDWQAPWKNSKSIKIVSDGDGIDVFIFKDSKGKVSESIRLDYAEAEELGIALVEYTKGDPNCPEPLYEVFDKKVTVTPKAKKVKKSKKSKKNPLDGYAVLLP